MKFEVIDDGKKFDAAMNHLDEQEEAKREATILHSLNEALDGPSWQAHMEEADKDFPR